MLAMSLPSRLCKGGTVEAVDAGWRIVPEMDVYADVVEPIFVGSGQGEDVAMPVRTLGDIQQGSHSSCRTERQLTILLKRH